MPFSSHPGCQCLLFDADDTLWENNIYFERVISRFINLLHSAHCPPAQIRALLHEAGLRYIESHGYGTRVFARVLVDVLQQLSMGEPASELQQSVI
jgi:putative hydrolase of the HAD superfamily